MAFQIISGYLQVPMDANARATSPLAPSVAPVTRTVTRTWTFQACFSK